ncbi:hypothetical protein BFT35_01680 [Thermoanaerobacterium thermosaccharolyticum]|uniref:Uncharacterized protein n=1 Tax=Thermoanaerobacterium thermosaccharolyticum TaxID=1517 RepID=A0A231VGR4_THETR|nr:DUF6323 family protein [Thermoanaerobacterium thermosaccharolyticum]AST58428.1 hypothetical protein Thert_02571 [Thermoanaerobacterium thermosaccharolyticum]OXT07383.1 hypothetical protein CE561_07660 [Thermoanaerobacterium thermosaccharolyticum]PHO08199.1 hypothetical protein BFT35_01680 [Thermoanaerobacterium thermosaccharolyticum]
MSLEIMNVFSSMMQKHAVDEIVKCNDFTSRFGLTLSRQDAIELVKTRALSLKSYGRIEFGGGVIEKIIKEFCDSPYISMHNYVETLHRLIDIFYFYKNETLDLISDDELIKFMKDSFDGKCQGSLELLSGRELYKMARNLRYGYAPDYSEDNECEEEDEDGEY